MTTSIETLHVWDTVYSADSVEWCPLDPYQSLFVCGTYQLSEEPPAEPNPSSETSSVDTDIELSDKPAKRLGRLYLFSVSAPEGLVLKQTLDLPAILDLKWCHAKIHGRILLAVANADSEVLIYELDNSNLVLATKCDIGEEGTLALSLDWSTGRDADDPSIVVSDSKGCVSVLKLTPGGLDKTLSWKAHSFEAWIAAFDYWTPSIVYTGGDDSKFRVYDTRLDPDTPILTSSVHGAGVTSLHSHAGREHTLASGSYDEHLRLWDTRSMARPSSTADLGGGVWRSKWEPDGGDRLLAACMHGGFRVVACEVGLPPRVVASYRGHDSLAYGSDWCHLAGDEVAAILPSQRDRPGSTRTAVVGTCSFYDHKLCVSAVRVASE